MTNAVTLPDLGPLRALLSSYLGKRAYIVPMTDHRGVALGNNGDDLMLMVFGEILKAFAIEVSSDPSCSDVAIVPPNGALLEIYGFPGILADRLVSLRHLPLVIFPSSAYFPSRDPSFMFRNRQADTLWILREKRSFDHLRETWLRPLQLCSVRLALDHDVVASGHAFVPAIIGAPSAKRHTLVAARVDREAFSLTASFSAEASTTSGFAMLGKRLVESIPHARVRTAVARALRRDKLHRSGKRLLAKVRPTGLTPHPALPVRFVDSSARQFATFDEYCDAIRNADLILTDRLHIGLPGAVLGKRVVLVEAGYHKLGGVYQQSLSLCANVTFISG